MYIDRIEISEQSKKRLGFFMKIEEVQITIFLFLCKEIRPDNFLDVGANVGFYSLILKKYFPHVKVFAFEPTPETFRELEINFSMNPGLVDGCSLHNLAISSSIGTIDFMNFGEMSGRNGIASTSIHRRSESTKVIKVSTVCLDDLNEEIAGSCMIKVDTEGHEVDVIRGGEGFLRRNNCVVQIEEGHGKSEGCIKDIFAAYGYSKILKIGPDSYYTNVSKLHDPTLKLRLVEASMNFLVEHRWNKNPSI
jgi:FkbM family methyltransferase